MVDMGAKWSIWKASITCCLRSGAESLAHLTACSEAFLAGGGRSQGYQGGENLEGETKVHLTSLLFATHGRPHPQQRWDGVQIC